MNAEPVKVGVISCSGEAVPEGTISRLATRRVLELLRPDATVTLCLPLFLAGNEGERNFARAHPTITVDGCPKQCARWGTEQHSGPVSAALMVSDLLGTSAQGCHQSTRDLAPVDQEAVWAVADRIAAEVDALRDGAPGPSARGDIDARSCGCSSPVPAATLRVASKAVPIPGLPLIFAQCAGRGLAADAAAGPKLLEGVRIYHSVPPGAEADYRDALVQAYREFRAKRETEP